MTGLRTALLAALAAALLLGAGVTLRRGRGPAPPAETEASAGPKAKWQQGIAAHARGAEPRGAAKVPRLLSSDEPSVEIGRHPWHGAGALAAEEREKLGGLERQARARALTQLGLRDDEAIGVRETQRRGDERLAALEAEAAAQLSREPTAVVNVRPLRAEAAAELDQLARQLGPARARQLRELERREYRRLFAQSFPSPSPALDNAHRRRSMWLRWDPASVVEVARDDGPR